MEASRQNQGPQVAFFARRALIRRQRAAVNKAAGELVLADLLRAASTYPTRWRRRLARRRGLRGALRALDARG